MTTNALNFSAYNNNYTLSGNVGYGYGNYGGYTGNSGFGAAVAGGGPAVAANPFMNPTDSVTLSSGALNNDAPWAFGTQDVCECNFSHNAASDAFIVPAGDQDNPYQNFNATALPLNAANGQDPQQALLALLTQLGITPEMLAALREMGVDLLSLIAQANGVDSLGGIQNGQELVLPTTFNSNSGSAPSNYYGGDTGNGNYGSQAPVADYSDYVPAVETPAAAPTAPATGSGNVGHDGDSHDHVGPTGGRGPRPGRAHNGDSHDHVGDAGGHGRGHNNAPNNGDSHDRSERSRGGHTGGGGGGRVATVR